MHDRYIIALGCSICVDSTEGTLSHEMSHTRLGFSDERDNALTLVPPVPLIPSLTLMCPLSNLLGRRSRKKNRTFGK